MKSFQQISDKLGSVLAYILIILFVMTLVVFAIAMMSTRNLNNVVGEYWEDRAYFAAFSGVQRVLTELGQDPNFNDAGGTLVDVPLSQDPDITWTVKIENNVGGAAGYWASDNRTWVPAGGVYIHSVGRLRNLAVVGITSLATLVTPQRPVFNDAIFGVEGVTLDNSQTISWYPGVNAEKEAHVTTNAITDSVITISNGSLVDGDAISGVDPLGTATPVFKDGASTIVGTIKKADESKITTPFSSPVSGPPLPTVTGGAVAAPQELTPGAYGAVELDGTAVTLKGGGNYYFQNYIDLRNNAVLNVDGATLENPATVYFNTSAVFWNDTRVNWDPVTDTPHDPRLLQIYSVDPTASQMYISEVDRAALVVAGENLDVLMTDAVLHGAVIGKSISAVASVVRYDTRLKGVPLDGTGGFQILSMVVEPKNSVPDPFPPGAPPNQVAVHPPPPPPGAPPPPAIPPGVNPPPPPGPVY